MGHQKSELWNESSLNKGNVSDIYREEGKWLYPTNWGGGAKHSMRYNFKFMV